eukprot:5022055-Pyramimonas_sp.AAC.1
MFPQQYHASRVLRGVDCQFDLVPSDVPVERSKRFCDQFASISAYRCTCDLLGIFIDRMP